MNAFDLACLGGEPEGLPCNAEKACGLVQVEPRLVALRRRPEDRNLVMRPVRRDPFARPAIAMPGHQAVAVENAGNQIVADDQYQFPHGGDDVGGGAVALSAAPLRQAQFGVNPADPVDQQDDLGGFVINIGDMMARWTNERWASTLHRVVNPPLGVARSRRLSIGMFVHPNYDQKIECVPTCLAEGEKPRYPVISAGEHIKRKIERSHQTA